MNIEKKYENAVLTLSLSGRLDSTNASVFDKEIEELPEGIKSLVLDFANLEYISSAGLRVVLRAKKVMNRLGELTVVNVNELVLEILEITGFRDILGL